MDPGKFLLLPPPPPTESIRAKLGLPPPPQMDVGPYAYAWRFLNQSFLLDRLPSNSIGLGV